MNVREDFFNCLSKNLVDPELQSIWSKSFSETEMEDYVRLHTRYQDVAEFDLYALTDIRFMDLTNLIFLRACLVNDKDGYLTRFIAGGGIAFLLRVLVNYLNMNITEDVAAALFEILQCCKLTLDKSEGIKEFLGFAGSAAAVAKCLLYEFRPLAILGLDVLAVCCFWEDSTSKVVRGLEERGKLYNEELFDHLYKGLSAENMEITAGVMELIVRLLTDPMDSYCRKLIRMKLNKHTIKTKCEEISNTVDSNSTMLSHQSSFESANPPPPLVRSSSHVSSSESLNISLPRSISARSISYSVTSNQRSTAPPTVANTRLFLHTPYTYNFLYFFYKETMYKHYFELTPTHILQINDEDPRENGKYKISQIQSVHVPSYSTYSQSNYLLEITFCSKCKMHSVNSGLFNTTQGNSYQRTLVLGFNNSTDQLQWHNALNYYHHLLQIPESSYYFYKKYLYLSRSSRIVTQESPSLYSHSTATFGETVNSTSIYDDDEFPYFSYCLDRFDVAYSKFLDILDSEKLRSLDRHHFDMNNIDELYDKLYEELLINNHEHHFLNLLQNCLSFSFLAMENSKMNEKGWIHLVEYSNQLLKLMQRNEFSENVDEEEEVFEGLVPLPTYEEVKEMRKHKRKTKRNDEDDGNDDFDSEQEVEETAGGFDEGIDKETLYKQINKLAKLSVVQKQEIKALKKQQEAMQVENGKLSRSLNGIRSGSPVPDALDTRCIDNNTNVPKKNGSLGYDPRIVEFNLLYDPDADDSCSEDFSCSEDQSGNTS
jgi:hypothetical protein